MCDVGHNVVVAFEGIFINDIHQRFALHKKPDQHRQLADSSYPSEDGL